MAKASRKKPERLAEKLLEIRQKLGLSQNGLIRRLGLTEELEQDYVSKFERGVLVPPCTCFWLTRKPQTCGSRH